MGELIMGIICMLAITIIMVFFIMIAIIWRDWYSLFVGAILSFLTMFAFFVVGSIIINLIPIKHSNQILTHKDTIHLMSLPDQTYIMHKGNSIYSYEKKDLLKEGTLYQDVVDGIKIDSTKIIFPYIVRYTISTRDSSTQKTFFGHRKTDIKDTLIISNLKYLRAL
jgi:hypothetical protein